jgi:Family of unknown function (DUF6263)
LRRLFDPPGEKNVKCRRLLSALGLAALLVLIGCTAGKRVADPHVSIQDGKYLLRLNLKKGDSFTMRIESSGQSHNQIFDKEIEGRFNFDEMISNSVTSVGPEGAVWIEYFVEQSYSRYEHGEAIDEFDSTKASGKIDPSFIEIAVGIDEPFRYKVSAIGEALEAEDTVETVERLIEKAKVLVGDGELDAHVADQLRLFYSPEMVKEKAVFAMPEFPEKPVAIGESWSKSYNSVTAAMVIDRVCTLKSVKEKDYVVACSNTSRYEPSLPATQYRESEPKKRTIRRENLFRIDRETGWVVEAERKTMSHVIRIDEAPPWRVESETEITTRMTWMNRDELER